MGEKEQTLKAISKRLDRIEETLDKVVDYLKEDEIELDLNLEDIYLPVDEEYWEEEEKPKKPSKKSHEEKVRAELEAQSSEVEVIEKTVPEEE